MSTRSRTLLQRILHSAGQARTTLEFLDDVCLPLLETFGCAWLELWLREDDSLARYRGWTDGPRQYASDLSRVGARQEAVAGATSDSEVALAGLCLDLLEGRRSPFWPLNGNGGGYWTGTARNALALHRQPVEAAPARVAQKVS